MQFDLFTFLASLFNFIVLLVLLRIFLFKRITRAMEQREQKIQNRWDEAESSRTSAREKEEEYAAKLDEVEEKRREMLNEAREKAEQAKEEQLRAARREVEEQRKKWLDALNDDKKELLDTVERRMAEQTAAAVRETLSEFAGVGLLEMMVERFTARVDSASEKISSSFHNRELTVVSSDKLSDGQRETIRTALDRFNHNGVEFQTDASLVCGIEVKGEGSKLSWSIAGRMNEIDEFLEKQLSGAASEGAA